MKRSTVSAVLNRADYETVAYDARIGIPLGAAVYDGNDDPIAGTTWDQYPSGIAVSPDGARVFVTGTTELTPFGYGGGGWPSSNYSTVAYCARAPSSAQACG